MADRHVPVLLEEVLTALDPRPGQTVVDCTIGLGGHSAELLRRISPDGTLIGIDFDPANLERARARLTPSFTPGQSEEERNAPPAPPRVAFHLFHNNFAALPTILAQLQIDSVDSILADIGVASPQIDDPNRGFSYRQPGPLDMRMDPTRGEPASALLHRMSEIDLADAILTLGDETDAPEIARLIVNYRKTNPIETTQDLTKIVCDARNFTLQRAAGAKLHPAARTFQALRMLVNRELPNLQRLLGVAPQCLSPGGRIAIISFHSGEDRLVKKSFRDGLRNGTYSDATDEPITATEPEIRANPRSRSAKLRWAQRSS